MEQTIRELTFHIGMPKTATTTLQRHVFPGFSGYVGKFARPAGRGESVREQAWRPAFDEWVLARPSWPNSLRATIDRLAMLGEDRILLSEECLSWWPLRGVPHRMLLQDGWTVPRRVGPHPVLRLLEVAKAHLSERGRVRAIVTFRNQTEFLGAFYAEDQRNANAPSQRDFEAKVHEAIAVDDPWLDYAELVDGLHAVLHPTDVLVLLHEDGVTTNVARIAAFLDVRMDGVTGTMRENVRRVGDRTWSGSDRILPITKLGVLGRVRNQLDSRWPAGLRFLEGPLKSLLARLDVLVARRFQSDFRKGIVITMPDELAVAVRDHCAPSNRRLAALLDRELDELGY